MFLPPAKLGKVIQLMNPTSADTLSFLFPLAHRKRLHQKKRNALEMRKVNYISAFK